jgi:glycosyltransferase involved in cell wall biosynthesis
MIFINGRFLSQRTTGVQRFAREITTALDGLLSSGEAATQVTLVVPKGVANDLDLKAIGVEWTGNFSGHAWEQIDLYRFSRNGVLINLGNSGPVLHSRSITIMHDAMVYRMPQNFSFAYRSAHQTIGRALALRSDIGTVSDFSRRELMDTLGLRSAFIAHNGTEHLARVQPDDAILRQLGVTAGQYFLAVGSRAPNKNLGALSQALELLGPAAPKLVVVGAGAKIFGSTDADLNPSILLAGPASDAALTALYQGAIALLFPSLYEGFGIPPLEAMTLGCPVIASDIPPVREVCAEAALYFDPANPAAIAAAMTNMMSRNRDSLIAGGHARSRIFSWRKSARILLDRAQQSVTARP